MNDAQSRLRWDRIMFLFTLLVFHIAFAGVVIWWMDDHQTGHLADAIIPISEALAMISYAVIIVAAIWAGHNRLNLALSFQKFYWLLLLSLIAFPFAIGYPFGIPNWLRLYIWMGIGACSPWVLFELARINGWIECCQQVVNWFRRRL